MSRPCTVCTSHSRAAIDQALVSGTSVRAVASQFSVSRSAVSRHMSDHLADTLIACGPSEDERGHTINAMDELTKAMRSIDLLSDACDAWLRDPNDPSRYSIDPRDHQIHVVYAVTDEQGKERRLKRPLSEILEQMEGAGMHPLEVENRQTDPCTLLLKTANRKLRLLRLLVGIEERLYNAQTIKQFETIVLDAIGDVAPDVRAAIEENLRLQDPFRQAVERPGR